MMSMYYKHRARFVFRVLTGSLLAACIIILLAVTIAGFFDRFSWLCDLVVHFRVQYAAALFICALLSGFLRSNRIMTAAWIGLLVNLVILLITYWGRTGSDSLPGERLRLTMINVNTANRLYVTVRTAIRAIDPDILVVEEIDKTWLQELEPLKNTYPYSCVKTRPDNFGIGVFSKLPLVENEIVYTANSGVPWVRAAIIADGRKVTILGMHTLPPGTHDYWLQRNEQLTELAAWCSTNTGPLLVAGDLNTTPWSYSFRKLVRDSGLTDSACGWRYQPTWPVWEWLLRIPVDHVLNSADIQVLERTTGPDIGSDHLPVSVEFVVRGW
jgi:endonuclease/exonuclease/phosphatase (EEP) superfamily protein YafD